MKFFRELRDLIRFILLPQTKRTVVFYSENKNYWVHLEGLLLEMLQNTKENICYISSNSNDPGLLIQHERFSSFKIDEGSIRDWLFKNIDTKVMIMTMPSLNKYQVKKSRFPVHYIYTQHSLNSLHMMYENGAFDHFDTIFCCGPHHVNEVRALEKKYGLPKKKIVKHGYYRLESILNNINNSKNNLEFKSKKNILIAPSWGKNGLIETIGDQVIDELLKNSFRVTLRPHPETLKKSKNKINNIIKKFGKDENFFIEVSVDSQKSLHESNALISDWSGVAFEYFFSLNKPVFFFDTEKKINNSKYEELKIEPFESYMRNQIGKIIELKDIKKLDNLIIKNDKKIDISDYVYNVGQSSRIGSKAIVDILNEN